jgi:hypothetical protein
MPAARHEVGVGVDDFDVEAGMLFLYGVEAAVVEVEVGQVALPADEEDGVVEAVPALVRTNQRSDRCCNQSVQRGRRLPLLLDGN